MKPQHCSRRDAAPSPPSSYSMAPPHFPPNGFKFPLHGLRHPALYPRGLFPPGMFHPDSRFSIPPLLALSTVHHSRLPGRLGGYMHPFQHAPRGYNHPQDQKSPNHSVDHGLSYSGGGGSRMHGSGSPVSSHAEKRKYKNHLMSRSPVCGHSRSRSPVSRQTKTRSPGSVMMRSRSPVCGQRRSESPACVQSRSRSPPCVQTRSGSPVCVQSSISSPGSPFSNMQSARSIKCTQSTSQATSCNTTVTNSDTGELRMPINSSREEVREHFSNNTDEIWEQQNINKEDHRREEIGRHRHSKAENSWNQRREELEKHGNSGTDAWDYRREELERHGNSSTEEAWDHRREELVRHRNSSTEEARDNRREELERFRNSSAEEVQDHRREELERCRNNIAEESHDHRREELQRHRNHCIKETWGRKREELERCRNNGTEESWDHTREELVRYKGHHTEVRLHTASHTEEVRRHTDSHLENIRYADSHTEEARRSADGHTEEVERYLVSCAEEMRMHTDSQTEKDVNCSDVRTNDMTEHRNHCSRMSSSERQLPSDDEPPVTKSSLLTTSESSTVINTALSSTNGELSSSLNSEQVFSSLRIDPGDHPEPQTEPLSLVKNSKSSDSDDLIPSASNQETVLAPNRPFRNIIKISRLGGSIGSGSGFSQILPLKKRICTAFAMEQDTAILPFRAPLALNSIRGKPLCTMTESVSTPDDHASVVDLSTDLATYIIDSSPHNLSKKHGLKGSSVQMTGKKRKSRNQRDRSVSGLKKHANLAPKSKCKKAQHKPLFPVTNSQRRTRSQTRRSTEVVEQVKVFAEHNTDKTTEDTMNESPNVSSSKGTKLMLTDAKQDSKDDDNENDCSSSKMMSSLVKASMKKDSGTECVDGGVKHMTKGRKRPSSKGNSVTRNKNITSVKKNSCKTNLCKKAKCSKLQGKSPSHHRNSASTKEVKSPKKKRQTKMGSSDNDDENRGLHTDNGCMHVIKDINIHVGHISCINPTTSLVHNVSTLQTSDKCDNESPPAEKHHDLVSGSSSSDGKVKGMKVVGTLSPIIKTLLGQPACGVRDVSDPVLMQQLSLKIPDVFVSKVTGGAYRSGLSAPSYPEVKVDMDAEEEARTYSKDCKMLSPQSDCLKSCESERDSITIKDVSVKICRLSPKALSEKKTARASVVEKQACPITSHISVSKSSDFVKKEDQSHGSGLLEDLLWQVQKGYFLRRGEEKSSISIDEAASVTQAVSYDENSLGCECTSTYSSHATAVCQNGSQLQKKAEAEGQSYEVRVEEISDDEMLDCKQHGQSTHELPTKKQKYDSDEDNSDLSDRPLVIDIPPESESNVKSSLLDSCTHASPNATEDSNSGPNSVSKQLKCSQRKPRKVHCNSSKRCKPKTDILEEENNTQVLQDFTSSDLSGELEKDIIDNGKDSGIESAGIPEQLKESPCEVSEAGERQKGNNHESNGESQLPDINSVIIKPASSMPKTTTKNRLRFRGIDDICASLVIRKVANKEISINQSSLTSSEEERNESNVDISSEELLPCNQNKQEIVKEKLSEFDEAKTCTYLSREKTDLEEKRVPSPQEDFSDTSMENKVEVSEKPVQSVKKDTESGLESPGTETVSAEMNSEAEAVAKNDPASVEVTTECSGICERSGEQVVGNTGPLESEKSLVNTTDVDSVASLTGDIVEDSEMDTNDTEKTPVTTEDIPQADSFRRGSRAAKRKALAYICKDKKDASDMQEEAAVVKDSSSLSPQPLKKKRGRPSKLQAKCCEQGSTRLKQPETLIEQSALPEDVPMQQEQSLNSEMSKPPVRHKKLSRKKAKSVPRDNDNNELSITKAMPSPVNENMKDSVALKKSDDWNEENQDVVKQCSDCSDHAGEGTTKKFFTSHSARNSKFSPPYMLLSSLINPSSRKTLSPYSIKKPQPTAKSSLDIYDFDEDDEEVEVKAIVKCNKPPTDKNVVSAKGKRGRKPKCQKKLTRPTTEVVEQVRDYVQRTESYRPQSRFLRPRNRINYNENELDKPLPSQAKDSNAKQCLPKMSVNIKKPTLSLKIKVPRPVAKVDSAVSGENELHHEADVSVFNRDLPQSESNTCSKVHQRRCNESGSNSHKMTVTSETISITTNEVTHYGSDSDDFHEYSQPIVRAPDINEMNAHHHNKDSNHTMAVLNHHVRFRLIKIGQGLWKTSNSVHNPSISMTVDKQYEHASTQQEQLSCVSNGSDDDNEDDVNDDDLNNDTEDDKMSSSSSYSGMPDLDEDADYYTQIDAVDNYYDDTHDNSSSSPPVLQRTSSGISPKHDKNISYASNDFDASPTSVSVNTAANSFSSCLSPKSQYSGTNVSVFASPNSAPLKSRQRKKSACYESSSVSHQVVSINEKTDSLQLSVERPIKNKKWSRSLKLSPEIHVDYASTSGIARNTSHNQHQSSTRSSPARSGHRGKSTSEDHKVDPCPNRVLHSRYTPGSESTSCDKVSVEDNDESELELLPPDLDLFVDNRRKTGPRKVSEPKLVLKTSPGLKYLACVEDISDPDSDGEKEKVDNSQIRDFDMPVLCSQRSQSQMNSSNGQAKFIDNDGAGFLVPTPPPKYEPENVLEEAVQFDSEMSQSSCSTPSYPIVSPLTLGENKPEKVDNDSKSVDADEMDFAESFLNGARTLSAEIEEQIRKQQHQQQQQQQIQMEKQGQAAKCGQELLPAVDITPFAPDFQDMDYVYDLGLMSMSSTTNGTVYGSLNPAVINNKTVQNQDCSSQSTGSNRSDKKSSENKRRTTKSRSKKHSAIEKQVTSSSPARIDNEMDKLLSQQSIGFELLDDFDETPFNVNSRTIPNQLGDLFEPSDMDNLNCSHGTDFTFSQSDSRGLHTTPSYDSASDMVLQCVDIKEQSKTFIHRQGSGSSAQCQTSNGVDTQRLTNQGSRRDVSMGTSAMGMHTCDCGAQFTDQWSYQEHEVFCSGPHLFNCGL